MTNKPMKNTILAVALLFTQLTFAETLSIPLNKLDQTKLRSELAHLTWIDPLRVERQFIQVQPYPIAKVTYQYLSELEAFSISCSEYFIDASTEGTDVECKVQFNYALSSPDRIEVKNGFMSDFVVASIHHNDLAKILYNMFGDGTSDRVFFQSSEQRDFVHPSTGQTFLVRRLRVDCDGNQAHHRYSCKVSAIKK